LPLAADASVESRSRWLSATPPEILGLVTIVADQAEALKGYYELFG